MVQTAKKLILLLVVVSRGVFAADITPEQKAHADYAIASFSDNTQVDGVFSLTAGKQFEILDTAKSKRFSFAAEELANISIAVEDEKLEQGWMFREESDHTKIKLPYKYPTRKLLVTLTLKSGEIVKGHANGVFYIERGDEQQRFFLQSYQKGEKNQALADLVYLKEIKFPNRVAGKAQAGTIAVAAPAAAVQWERETSYQSPLRDLLTGRYDVVLFRLPKIRYGLSGGPVKPEDLKNIDQKVQAIEEFFTKKKIVAAVQDGAKVRAIIELTRAEASHDQGWRYARWEAWTFEPTAQTWDVKKRMLLHRERFSDKAPLPDFEYVRDEKLCGVAENAKLE